MLGLMNESEIPVLAPADAEHQQHGYSSNKDAYLRFVAASALASRMGR